MQGLPYDRRMSRVRRLHAWLLPDSTGVGWTPYLWLFYLLFFFVEWLFYTPTPMRAALMLGTVLVFLPLYFSGFQRSGVAAVLHIVGIMLLGMAWTPSNVGAAVFYIYAASFACTVGRIGTGVGIIVLIMLTALLMWQFFQPSVTFVIPAVVFSGLIGAANLMYTVQGRKNAELRLSQAEVRRLARVAERERIARDLHDVLGHTLSLIVLKSELAGRLIGRDSEAARSEMKAVEETARKALGEVRQAISGFHEMSLLDALEQARLALRSADIALAVELDEPLVLPAATEAMLGLVIREAVTNIIRHADARHCLVSLHREGQHYRLSISDDGHGQIRPDGSGVQGMRARIESLRGELHIKAGQLIAEFPMVAA